MTLSHILREVLHLLDEHQSGGATLLRTATIALAFCGLVWTALTAVYVALAITRHPMLPTQLNTLLIVGLSLVTLLVRDLRQEALRRTRADDLDRYARGFVDGVAKRVGDQKPRSLHSVDR